MSKCEQVCPYNTLQGCKVIEYNRICPLTNTKNELLENTEQLTKTKDVLIRGNKKYEVVIADDNIFVICPIVYSKREKAEIVRYSKAEIYANQRSINTLRELGFEIYER